MRKSIYDLYLLIWKNLMLQKRKPVENIFGVLVVILACLLICVIHLIHNTRSGGDLDIDSPRVIGVPGTYWNGTSLVIIFWSPCRNAYVNNLIRHVAKDLLVDDYCYENSSDLQKSFLESQHLKNPFLVGVQFQDELADQTQIPTRLRIAIRMSNYWDIYGDGMPVDSNAGYTRNFYSWQHYLFKHIIKLHLSDNETSSQNNNRTIKMRDYYQYDREGSGDDDEDSDEDNDEDDYEDNDEDNDENNDEGNDENDDEDDGLPKIEICSFPRITTLDVDHFRHGGKVIRLILVVAFLILFFSILRNIAVEKEIQIKEIMKIMGINNWLHWTAWCCTWLLYALIMVIVIVVFMSVNVFRNESLFILVPPDILFVYLMLYALSLITFALAITVFFRKSYMTVASGTVLFLITIFPSFYTVSSIGKLGASLLPNSAMVLGMVVMMDYEMLGRRLTWGNLFESATPHTHLSVGLVMLIFLVDTVIYMVITLYAEAVFPGSYGLRRVWYFPFTSKFWFPKPSSGSKYNYKTIMHEENYEPEPYHLDIGIQVWHLKKKYGKDHSVLRNINFNMFENEITILLGQNGAGKTTLMSILTGILPATYGTAIIGGYDIRTDMDKIRKSIGFCPQNNVLFNLLTVKEHLFFFCKIRGLTGRKLKAEIELYLKLLDLTHKAKTKVIALSGGMKRKLSIAIAMCGNPKVCILDEPTAGLDPTSSRQVWNTIQTHKIGRTILLSTHLMKEADVLGDRIAILANGTLQCYGSSFFLKKMYTSGYRLTVVKNTGCNNTEITRLLRKHIPVVSVETDVGNELTYILPESETKVFEQMLGDLEAHRQALAIQSYGISLATLEEVFMRVQRNFDQENNLTDCAPNTFSSFEGEYLTGFELYMNQILAMLLKKGLLTLRRWLSLVVHIVVPTAIAIYCLENSKKSRFPSNDTSSTILQESIVNFSLDIYNSAITVTTSIDKKNQYYTTYKECLGTEKRATLDWGNVDMNERMLEEFKKGKDFVTKHYIIGASFNINDTIMAWYIYGPYHSIPLSLQYIYNAIVEDKFGSNLSVEFSNYPRPKEIIKRARITGIEKTAVQSFPIVVALIFVVPYYGLSCATEKLSRYKDIQLASGTAVSVFWLVTFVWDFVTYEFIFFCVVIIMVWYDLEFTYEALVVLHILFVFAVLPLVYLITCLVKRPVTAYSITSIFCAFGVLGYLAVTVVNNNEPPLLLMYYPFCTVLYGLYNLFLLYGHKQMGCKNTSILTDELYERYGCGLSYYSKERGVGDHLIYLATTSVTLFLILFIHEYKICDYIIYSIFALMRLRPIAEGTEDADVLVEKMRVRSGIIQPGTHAVVLKDTTKYFKKFLAVNQLCLGVKKYECFGLLGVNGAGKTTTFKMLIGNLKISFGDGWISRWSLKGDIEEARTCIGYCPQSDCLLGNLTGKEILIIQCLIRGIPIFHCNSVVIAVAKSLKFENLLNKRIKHLSGGNKRKIQTAIALIGKPPVICLDEPSAGMDPSAKVFLWNTLCKVRDSGRCLILTTHNMDECEAICTRAGIMVNGAFQCLGSPQYLKNKFANGFMLMIKVKKAINDKQAESNIEKTELFVQTTFPLAELQERHENLLTYLVKSEQIKWATIFGTMEKAKKTVAIEDYSLSQFDLEQIFLLFTKMQKSKRSRKRR